MNYVLYGEETFRLQSTIRNIMKEYVTDCSELNSVSYDATQTSLDTILEDAMTVPFFSDQKVILVTNANFLSANNDTNIDVKGFEYYVEHPMESTILILAGNFAKLDMRKKMVKKIKASWKVLEFRKLDDIGKESYIKEEIERYHLLMAPGALRELHDRLPLDMGIIHKEMEKLALYGDEITKDVVEHLVNRVLEDDVFALVNAVVNKNLKKAMHIWRDLSVTNTDPIYLIALLAGQFRFLFEVKSLMMKGMSKDHITTTLGAHPYRVKVSMESADTKPIASFMHMLERLAHLDQQIKGGFIEKKLGFEMFLLESTRS